MKSRRECIEYFIKGYKDVEKNIQKLYLKGSISENSKAYICKVAESFKKRCIEDIGKNVDISRVEGASYCGLYSCNIFMRNLLVVLIERDKINVLDFAEEMEREDLTNACIVKGLNILIEHYVQGKLQSDTFLYMASQILKNEIFLNNYSLNYFEDAIYNLELTKGEEIVKYASTKE